MFKNSFFCCREVNPLELGQSRFVNVVIHADLNSRFGCFLMNISSGVKEVFTISSGLTFEGDLFGAFPPFIKAVQANAIIIPILMLKLIITILFIIIRLYKL